MEGCPNKDHPIITRTISRLESRAASSTGVNELHGEAIRPTKLVWGSGATGSLQVLPGGLAELPHKRVGQPRNAE